MHRLEANNLPLFSSPDSKLSLEKIPIYFWYNLAASQNLSLAIFQWPSLAAINCNCRPNDNPAFCNWLARWLRGPKCWIPNYTRRAIAAHRAIIWLHISLERPVAVAAAAAATLIKNELKMQAKAKGPGGLSTLDAQRRLTTHKLSELLGAR